MIQHIGKAFLLLGLLFIAGAIGYDDYIVVIGIAYPIKYTMLKIGVGFAVCCFGLLLLWIGNEEKQWQEIH